MEILSIGEKIKRARIYKGYTLKDLCDGKISVSKMSCIENNKVGLDLEVLEYIAEKLDVEVDYLKEDVEEQILRNVNKHGNLLTDVDFEKEMIYNLDIAENYELYESAFDIVHRLFTYYLHNNLSTKLQNYLSKYYELCIKSQNEENIIIYNLDMGKYLFANNEYSQAINYYNNIRAIGIKKELCTDLLAKAAMEESRCYLMLREYQKAFQAGSILLEYTDNIDDKKLLADIYHHLSVIMLRNNQDFSDLQEKADKYFKEDYIAKAESIYNFAVIFFEKSENQKALKYLQEAIDIYPLKDKIKYTEFIIKNVQVLIEYDEINDADYYCENALNMAISLDNHELIEKAYYCKSIIFFMQSNYVAAEMYFNLALSMLTKFADKQLMYSRYMEIGNMYYKMGCIADSLKFFTLALSLDKNI